MRSLLVLGLLGCSTVYGQTAPVPPGAEEAVFQGIRVELLEEAHDGNFKLSTGERKQKVDPGSVLTLKFQALSVDARLAADKRWVALNEALVEFANLQKDYLHLLDRAKLLGTAVDPSFKEAADAVSDRAIAAFDRLAEPAFGTILPDAKLKELLKNARTKKESLWKGVLGYLSEQRATMYSQATAAATPRYFVVVRAYRLPKGGEAQQVHVEGYDSLPSRPIGSAHLERGLPSARELAQIQAQLAGAELVAEAVREIQANKDAIRTRMKQLVGDIDEVLQAQVDQYRQLAKNLEGKDVDGLMAELSKLNITEATRLATRIAILRRDLERVNQTLAPLRKRIEPLRHGNSVSLPDLIGLFQAIDGLNSDLKKLSGDLNALGRTISGFPADVAKVAAQIEQKASAKAKADLKKLLDEVNALAKGTGEDLLAGLPKTQAAVVALTERLSFLSAQGGVMTAADEIQASDGVIPRPLDKLDDGILDLRRTDAAPGDAVEVRVAFVAATAAAQPDFSKTEKQVNYAADVLNTGWHRRFSGDLIFAKAVKGEGSDTFKPNVAVSMEWHHYDRKRRDGWWNFLDPGFGVHAANLDQSATQNVELGAGLNMSIFGGLLRMAYGWNISVPNDRPYFWLGFGLFGSLNNLQVVQGPPGNKPTPK